MDLVRPIFVLGCPRSGTTLLQLMLHGHPRIAIPPETRFVLESYQIRRSFGDLSREDNRRRLAAWIVDRPATRFVDLGLDADAIRDEISRTGVTLGTAIGTVLRAYARRFGKVRWGDKRPAYVTNIPVLRRLFPTAQFVHIVRDGRDCVASLKAMPWHHTGVDSAISAWAQAVDHARWAARALPADTFHEMHYERLVADPEPHLRSLCRFLGEAYDPAMADPATQASVAVPESKTWHVRTRQPVGADRVGRWVDKLSPEEAGLCERVLESRLRAHGYPVHGVPPPPARDRLRYEVATGRHRLAPLRRAYTGVVGRIPGARAVADTAAT